MILTTADKCYHIVHTNYYTTKHEDISRNILRIKSNIKCLSPILSFSYNKRVIYNRTVMSTKLGEAGLLKKQSLTIECIILNT